MWIFMIWQQAELGLFLQPTTRGQSTCNGFIFGNVCYRLLVLLLFIQFLYESCNCFHLVMVTSCCFLKSMTTQPWKKGKYFVIANTWLNCGRCCHLWSSRSHVHMQLLWQCPNQNRKPRRKRKTTWEQETRYWNEQQETDRNSKRSCLRYA